ncbi:MAG: VTT domain-containing protein [Actinomycetota bacterium]|nr:VTT domain-containing protein [Actinomycetota bacterium]
MAGPILTSLGWFSQESADAGTAALSYPLMAGSVFLGSVVPVLPTGPIVAAAAALVQSTAGLYFGFVVLLAAASAFAGDVVTFAICRSQGSRALNWLIARHDTERLDWARDQISRHAWRFLIVGRILPGGRIPVLLAAGSVRYPWKAFLPAGATAAVLWAMMYAAIGVVGGVLFDSPLVAVAAAVVLALLITAVPAIYRRVRARNPIPESS